MERGTFDASVRQPQATGHNETPTFFRCNLAFKGRVANRRTAWVGSLQVRIPRTARVKIPLLDVDENLAGKLGFDFVGARRLWSSPSELE